MNADVFAWYSANTAQGKAKQSIFDNTTLTASDPSYTVETALELPLSVSAVRLGQDGTGTGTDPLELTHYYSATPATAYTAAGKTVKFVNGSGDDVSFSAGYWQAHWNNTQTTIYFTQATAPSTVLYASYEIKATVGTDVYNWNTTKSAVPTASDLSTDLANCYYKASDGSLWKVEDIAKALEDKLVSVSVDIQTGSRAMFYGLHKTTKVTAMKSGAAGESDPTSFNSDLDGIFTLPSTVNTITLGYFGLYVDGEGNSNNIDGSAYDVPAGFKITVDHRAS